MTYNNDIIYSSIMLDTLKISEDLKKSGLDSKIAKELANKFKQSLRWF